MTPYTILDENYVKQLVNCIEQELNKIGAHLDTKNYYYDTNNNLFRFFSNIIYNVSLGAINIVDNKIYFIWPAYNDGELSDLNDFMPNKMNWKLLLDNRLSEYKEKLIQTKLKNIGKDFE